MRAPYSPKGPHNVGVRDLDLHMGRKLSPSSHLSARLFYPAAAAAASTKTSLFAWCFGSLPILWTDSLYSAIGCVTSPHN